MKASSSINQIKLSKGTYSIAGICKNCGKTSLLNSLVSLLANQHLGILTTGRDGEGKDAVFGNLKPSVKLPVNTLFTCSSVTMNKLGSAVEIIAKLPFSAGNKQLWLLNTLREIETEIIGPGSAEAQLQIIKLMLEKGAEIILIDGSLDRKSIALSPKIKGVFLVVGGSYGSLEKITTELTRLINLSQIPVYKDKNLKAMEDSISIYRKGLWQRTEQITLIGNEQDLSNMITETNTDKLYFSGAVTDSILNNLKPALKEVKDIIIRHPLQLHINNHNLDYLTKTHSLFCLKPFNVIAVAVNSWSVTGNHLDSKLLRQVLRNQFPDLTVMDIYEG